MGEKIRRQGEAGSKCAVIIRAFVKAKVRAAGEDLAVGLPLLETTRHPHTWLFRH